MASNLQRNLLLKRNLLQKTCWNEEKEKLVVTKIVVTVTPTDEEELVVENIVILPEKPSAEKKLVAAKSRAKSHATEKPGAHANDVLCGQGGGL